MRETRNATKGTPPSVKKPVKGTPGKGTPKAEKKEDNDKLVVVPGENVLVLNDAKKENSEVDEKVKTVKDTKTLAEKTLAEIKNDAKPAREDSDAAKSIAEESIVMQVDITEDQADSTAKDAPLIEKAEEDNDEEDDDEEDDYDEEEDEDIDEVDNELNEAMPATENQKRKKLEVFVGGLNKEATVDDVKKVFESVGDVQEVRMTTNPDSGKNKGFAFVRFATAEQAARAATELDRTQILEKECAVVPSEENDTLFVGNICKSWTADQVTEKLNKYGVEGIDEMTLLKDPENEGLSRGHVFLDFLTHSDAVKAFKRLSKPDAIFGCDRSARVAWAEVSSEPDETSMAKVKSVFVGDLPEAWEKEKIEEYFGKFGAIERVVMSKNMEKVKRTDYAFVNFATRDAAMACVEALKETELTIGDVKVTLKVDLAKPPSRKRRVRGHRGSYPVGGRQSKQRNKATDGRGNKKKGEGARVSSQKKSKAMKRKAQEASLSSEKRLRDNQNRGLRNPRPGTTFKNTAGGKRGAFSRRGRITSYDDEDYMPLGARISPGYKPSRGYAGRPSRGALYPPRSAERRAPHPGLGAKRSYAAMDEEAAFYGAGIRGYPRARVDYEDPAIYSNALRGSSLVHESLGHILPRGHGYSTLTGAADYIGYGPLSGADPRTAGYPPAYYGSRGGSGAYY